MFSISTREDYGLLFMAYLAQEDSKKYHSLQSFSQKFHISEKYISNIVRFLKKANLVSTKEGYKGGYKLTNSPDTITVYDIFQALENQCKLVECAGKNPVKCIRYRQCITKCYWQSLTDEIKNFLQQKTLSDIIKQQEHFTQH